MKKENIKKVQLAYEGKTIEYNLIKSKIKNLYIIIKNGEIIVKSPTRVSDKYINEFVLKKIKWINKKLEEEKLRPKEIQIEKKDIEKLRIIVEESVKKYSNILGLFPNKVKIKDIKYAWGSCSINKNITISSKLAIKERKIIEYVVLHEICHLKYMNHSENFWNLVESQMQDYKYYRKQLNSKT